jgi:hypothetical protein
MVASISRGRGTTHCRRAVVLFGLVTIQALIGIVTIVTQVPIGWALAHQGWAVVVLGFAVAHWRGFYGAYPPKRHQSGVKRLISGARKRPCPVLSMDWNMAAMTLFKPRLGVCRSYVSDKQYYAWFELAYTTVDVCAALLFVVGSVMLPFTPNPALSRRSSGRCSARQRPRRPCRDCRAKRPD